MLFGDDCAGSLARASERAGWAEEITRAWAQGGANTLALARVVRSARRGLERGDWSRLWESRQLPFSRRKAQMLLVIAEGLDWANAQTFAQMPHGWSILYLLAQLERTQLERLIEDGLVHSRLKLSEAKELMNSLRPRNGQRAAKGPNITRRFEKFEEFVADTVEDWSPEQHQWAYGKLEAIALLIENPDSFHLPGASDHFHSGVRHQPQRFSLSPSEGERAGERGPFSLASVQNPNRPLAH